MSQIEAGRYPATIKSCHETETQNGKGQITFEFELDNGSVFTGHKSLEGGAYEWTVQMLRKVIAWNDDPASLNEQAAGKRCVIIIEMKPGYKDPSKYYPELKAVYPEGGASANLVDKLKSRLAGARKLPREADAPPPNPKTTPAPRSAPAPTRAPTAPINDEDVPF
jgi:hypothetical protein